LIIEAFVNGWFSTGDQGSLTTDGHLNENELGAPGKLQHAGLVAEPTIIF
jgi:hypothetical protein